MLKRVTRTLLGLFSALAALSEAPASAEVRFPYPDAGRLLASAPVTAANGWVWLPISQAVCRDGSATGIAVRPGTDPSKVMITMQGGGACFSGTTCAVNPAHFGLQDFAEFTTASANGPARLDQGIWDRTVTSNELKNVTHVFIPYCSGDLFAGSNNVTVDGAYQRFQGYNNVGRFIDYIYQSILPQLPGTPGSGIKEVKLAGFSAGGYGALLNTLRFRDKLPLDATLSVLDDSAPPFDAKLFRSCQQSRMAKLWRYDLTVIPRCGATCTTSEWLNPMFKRVLEIAPELGFSLISNGDDPVIESFSGFFGSLDCTIFGWPSATAYKAGLGRIEDQMKLLRSTRANTGVYYELDRYGHTFIEDGRYYAAPVVGGQSMQSWVQKQFTQANGAPASYSYLPY